MFEENLHTLDVPGVYDPRAPRKEPAAAVAARQRKFVEVRRDEGMIRRAYWATEREHEGLAQALAVMRNR